ncbi:DUF4276 family protein [Methylacidiphilum caldifontis]|uniref:DUF4276 family protein n=1 Tax=Methylacidiphilum caldifontis TaxID=2795386 RepID=A0A4Y8PCP1_9BACT|nr:DUF4276 family protein [Methylacidiphilum caldifontis]TFE68771.1 hypothetical protein A7Q10_07780 [Methylacidiphilum caldifontis]
MKVGLIVAGIYDEAVLPVLGRKFRRDVSFITRLCDGTVIRPKTVSIIEKDLYQMRKMRKKKIIIKNILVVEDSEGRVKQDVDKKIQQEVINMVDGSLSLNVQGVVIVQMMEAWLLADKEGLAKALGIPANSSLLNYPENIENILDPKKKLQEILPRLIKLIIQSRQNELLKQLTSSI